MTPNIYHCLRYGYAIRTFIYRQFTPLGLGVLVCLVVSAFIGMDTTQSVSYLIFTFSVALILFAMIAIRLIRFRFSAARNLPCYGTVNQPLHYRITILNQTPICQKSLMLFDGVTDDYPSKRDFIRMMQGSRKGRERRQKWREQITRTRWAIAPPVSLPDLPAESATEIMGEITPVRRGRLRFESMTLACPDPFGLMYKRVTCALPQSILILPKRYHLPSLNLPTSRRLQRGHQVLSSSVGNSSEFMALRDYRPGDARRKIHWKSWAKVGKPIVKEEQEEFGVRHGLLLDTFQPEAFSEFFEEAIAIASSLIHQLDTRDAILDLLLYSQTAETFSIGRGIAQTDQALQVLAGLQPCQTESFESILPFIHNRLSLFSSVICIFLTWDQMRHSFLRQLIQADIPSKTLLFSDGTFRPDATLMHDLAPNCRIHFLRRGHIQEDLRRI